MTSTSKMASTSNVTTVRTTTASKIDQMLYSFEGSKEEKVLQMYMGRDKEFNVKNTLLNLVIENCNASKPVSFTSADVLLEPVYRRLIRHSILRKAPIRNFVNMSEDDLYFRSVSFEMLFNDQVLSNLAVNGIRNCQEEYRSALLSLLTYLHDLEYHEKAIYDVKCDENDSRADGNVNKLTAVLSQHFFSQLVPSRRYVIDSRSKNPPTVCPCHQKECMKKITFGCTSLGSSYTWHGNASIILDYNIAVTVLEKQQTSEKVEVSEEDKDDEEEGPSPAQKDRKEGSRETNSGNSHDSHFRQFAYKKREQTVNLCVENKGHGDLRYPLLSAKALDHIIAETITNAFTRVITNSALSGWLIPTFGCTADSILIFLYDPKNDILLQCLKQFPLWERDAVLNVETIFKVWIYVNFTLFMRKNLTDEYELHVSKFHSHARGMLNMYRKLKNGGEESFSASADEYYSEIVMPYVEGLLKVAKRKEKN